MFGTASTSTQLADIDTRSAICSPASVMPSRKSAVRRPGRNGQDGFADGLSLSRVWNAEVLPGAGVWL